MPCMCFVIISYLLLKVWVWYITKRLRKLAGHAVRNLLEKLHCSAVSKFDGSLKNIFFYLKSNFMNDENICAH